MAATLGAEFLCFITRDSAKYLFTSQNVPDVLKSKEYPLAVVRAVRGSRSVAVLETKNLNTPGAMA